MQRNFSITTRLAGPACLLALLGGLTACRTTSVRESIGTEHAAEAPPVSSSARRAFLMRDGERVLGSLVRYEEQGQALRMFFSVRNSHGQMVGLIDALGRAYRYRPHQTEAQWLGTGTVLEGARRILDAGELGELTEVGLEELDHAR